MFSTAASANPLKLDVKSHTKCLLICAISTLSAFQVGVDHSLLSGFIAMPGFLKVYGYYDDRLESWNINPTVQQLITSLVTVGSFTSAILVGLLSSRFGRKTGMWAASVLNIIATAIMIGTTNLGALYLARFLYGFSVGWFIPFSQLYVHEVAPAHLRGLAFAFYECGLALAEVVGAVVDYATHNIESRLCYQIPLAVCFVVPVIQWASLFFFPESPRWLAVQGRETESWESLRRLRNSKIEASELLAEFNEIKKSTHEQLGLGKKVTFLDIWRGTNLRRTLLTIATLCFYSSSGASWLSAYGTYYLKFARVADPFGFSILAAGAGFIAAILSWPLIRYVDRRVIVIIGALICAFSFLVPAVAWTVIPESVVAGRVVVAFNVLLKITYVLYVPSIYLMGGEIPNSALRGYTFGIANGSKYIGNFLGSFSAPFFINPVGLNWGPKFGYIWTGSNVIVAIFAYFFLPETRDRTLEEIHEMFENRVPARKFKTYICVGVESYAAEARKDAAAQDEKVLIHERAGSTGMDSSMTTTTMTTTTDVL